MSEIQRLETLYNELYAKWGQILWGETSLKHERIELSKRALTRSIDQYTPEGCLIKTSLCVHFEKKKMCFYVKWLLKCSNLLFLHFQSAVVVRNTSMVIHTIQVSKMSRV